MAIGGIEMKNEYLISSKEDLEKVKKEDFAGIGDCCVYLWGK